jgi:hypothetical protein
MTDAAVVWARVVRAGTERNDLLPLQPQIGAAGDRLRPSCDVRAR